MQRSNSSKTNIAVASVILLSISLIFFAYSISFSTSPSITPSSASRPDTNDTLTCTWISSGDMTTANVTWYNGTNIILTTTGITTDTTTLLSNYTARGDNIYCNVTLTNDTDTVNSATNITIKNAFPSTPSTTNFTSGSIGNVTEVYEDIANNYTVLSTDPDSDAITYGYIGQIPSGSSLDSNTGIFTWTPAHTAINTNVTFYATDSYGDNPGITTKKIQFNLALLNDAPVISPALTNQTINESQVFNYVITTTDEELNYPLNFTINVTPALNLVIQNTSNTTAVIMYAGNATAGINDAGNYTINVTVRDSLGKQTNSTFRFQVSQVNVAPVINTIDNSTLTGTQGQAFSALFRGYDLDINQTLNFSITTTSCSYGNIWNNITTNYVFNSNSSNATGNLSISLLNNSHVVCRNIQIILVDERGAEDSESVFLNITNTNDPPIVHVLSLHSNNTESQTNLSRLTAYANAVFTYYVNATDVDSETYEGEVLTYYDNTTLFDINSTTGRITFTPNSSQTGSYLINITVLDDSGSSAEQTMNLTISSNSVPVLNPIGDITCYEDILCYVHLNASDADSDNVTFTSSNSTFPITTNATIVPLSRAYVNYTPNQSGVGNYSITITATDERGATDSETITFYINNTNDAPVLQSFTFPYAVETHAVAFNLYASDEDYSLNPSYEYVNFSVINLSGPLLFNISIYTNASNQTYGQVVFTVPAGTAGSYTYNFTATDYYGLNSTIQKSFTIYTNTSPPQINFIRPFNNSDGTANYTFINASQYTSKQVAVTIAENTSVVFDINVTDDTTSNSNINYTWYVGGVEVIENKSYTKPFTFFSSGSYDINVVVEDTTLENVSFAWNITVPNTNREPILVTNLSNLPSINGTTLITDYMSYYSSQTKFLDPDDDLDSDNFLDSNETGTLTFSATTCSIASISFVTNSVRITPTSVGNCSVIFTATDSEGLTLDSNTVNINVTQISNDTTEVEVQTSSSGGGSSRRSSAIPIPIVKEEVKPQALEIVAPEKITITDNNSITIPVTIKNSWNSSYKGITINVTSENKDLMFTLSKTSIAELESGRSENLTVQVYNYRLGEDSKIQIVANVTNPKVGDSAYIFLNSIEQSASGDDVETKVTFAQDLMNNNPECLELNELLAEAKKNIQAGQNLDDAEKLVDGVIEGCKYLVSVSKRTEQRPLTILEKAADKKYRPYLLTFAGASLLVALGMSFVGRRTKALKIKQEQDALKRKLEEEENAPYWQTENK